MQATETCAGRPDSRCSDFGAGTNAYCNVGHIKQKAGKIYNARKIRSDGASCNFEQRQHSQSVELALFNPQAHRSEYAKQRFGHFTA